MYQDISTLPLTKIQLAKLHQLGYYYLEDLTPEVLETVSIEKFIKIPETKTGFRLFEEELISGSILSYNAKLDLVLGNEVVPKGITELTGRSGSGKTQICFQLCVSVQLPKALGGINGEALYISTNNNFASHRLKELAVNFVEHIATLEGHAKGLASLSVDAIMQHIHYISVANKHELMACIQYLSTFLADKQIRLVIIDSISYPVKQFPKENRVAATFTLLKTLQMLSAKHNFAIVITNDLTTRVNECESYHTPSLGDSFYHFVNSRILLEKKNTVFYAKLLKSRCNKHQEAFFTL